MKIWEFILELQKLDPQADITEIPIIKDYRERLVIMEKMLAITLVSQESSN